MVRDLDPSSASLVFYSQGGQTEKEDGSFSQQNPIPHLTQQTWTQRDADWAFSYINYLGNKAAGTYTEMKRGRDRGSSKRKGMVKINLTNVISVYLIKDYMIIYLLQQN